MKGGLFTLYTVFLIQTASQARALLTLELMRFVDFSICLQTLKMWKYYVRLIPYMQSKLLLRLPKGFILNVKQK